MYHNKYLKYKSKYINLVNMIGGSYNSAKIKFMASVKKNTIFLLNDPVLEPIRALLLDIDGNHDNIFDYIIRYVGYNKENPNFDINWIIASYTNGTFGSPNSISLENITKFIKFDADLVYLNKKIKTLNNNITRKKKDIEETNSYKTYQSFFPILNPGNTNKSNYTSLVVLEEFLNNPKIIQLIQDFKTESSEKDARYRKMKEKGEDDFKLVFENTNVKIINPTTIDGSKYYGSNTKWCTTADEENQFSVYNDNGPLYIIQSKTNHKKFQFQGERTEGESNSWMFMDNEPELMDSTDKPISILDVVQQCDNDMGLLEWFKKFKLTYQSLRINMSTQTKLSITSDLQFAISNESYDDVNKTINERDNSKLEELHLDIKFWKIPIGNLLDKLTSLTILYLRTYNFSLGKSLDKLTSLRELHLNSYNLPLDNSLDKLSSLTSLYLNSYNFLLGNSLDKLTNLRVLHLNSYNLPLDNSLNNLTSLSDLYLNSYNSQLGNSLDKLTNLRVLHLNSYNLPLDNSLDKLTELRGLYLKSYNIKLDNSLDKLTKLKSLYLSSYNLPLGSSLRELTNLSEIHV